MRSFITSTGIGFIREIETEKIICKADIMPGEHKISDGYEFVQVADRAALDDVIVELPPINPPSIEDKIQEKLREIAIEKLTQEGKLTAQELQVINDAKS